MVTASAATADLATGTAWFLILVGAGVFAFGVGYIIRQFKGGHAVEKLTALIREMSETNQGMLQEALLTLRSADGGRVLGAQIVAKRIDGGRRFGTGDEEADTVARLLAFLREAPRHWTVSDCGYIERNLTTERLGLLIELHETLERRIRHLTNFRLWRHVLWRNKETRRLIGRRLQELRSQMSATSPASTPAITASPGDSIVATTLVGVGAQRDG